MSAETVVPVEIVRPKTTWSRSLGNIFQSSLGMLMSAWFVMLLAPQVYKPVGYWQTVAFILVIRNVIGDTGLHLLWTRERKS